MLDALAVTEEVQPPPCEWVALAPLVRDVLEHLDPHKGEADRVSLALPEHMIVWANGQLLRQVLRNLLSNAFKYCPKPARVTIHARQIDTAGQIPGSAQEESLCVQDEGPGILPGELPLLFQKFVRLQRDLSGTVQGSGLGLYISKQFVEAMQGRIWAESAGIAGQGSRFTWPFLVVRKLRLKCTVQSICYERDGCLQGNLEAYCQSACGSALQALCSPVQIGMRELRLESHDLLKGRQRSGWLGSSQNLIRLTTSCA